jgi:hypothetical protein
MSLAIGCFVSLILAAAAAPAATITADFLASPNQSNTASDAWQYFYGINTTTRSGGYTPLPVFDTMAFIDNPLQAWVMSTTPWGDIVGVG